MCLSERGEVYSFGYNVNGQLGIGNNEKSYNYGQLGLENNDNQNTPILCSSLSNEDVVDIKCGSDYTLVLTSNGDVLSCGNNTFGQLGRETADDNSSSFQKIEDLSEISRI